jgi:hypothetical protein
LTCPGPAIILGVGADSCGDRGGIVQGSHPDDPVIDLLVERGADGIEHPGGTLLAHLRRVASLLEQWGAGDTVQRTGLCHACYGTDGFPAVLLGLDERDVLVDLIGEQAEAWVYQYASCDRGAVYPELATAGPLRFRDRFTGGTSLVAERDAAVFVELTAANELDLVMVNSAWRTRVGPGLLELLRGTRSRLSDAGWDAWVSTVEGVVAETGDVRGAQV